MYLVYFCLGGLLAVLCAGGAQIIDGYSYAHQVDIEQLFPAANEFPKRRSPRGRPYRKALYTYYNMKTDMGIVLQKLVIIKDQNYIVILGVNQWGEISRLLLRGPVTAPLHFATAFLGRTVESSFEVAAESVTSPSTESRIPTIPGRFIESQIIADAVHHMLIDVMSDFLPAA